jgi:3-hydroxybutyryl-CoA dehydrogenase
MIRFGICGAGTMGAGIACAALQAGFRVFLYDTSEAARSRGITFIRETFAKAVEKEKMSKSATDEAMKHLTSCSALKELSGCDIVLEAIIEDKSVKHSLFTQLEAIMRHDAIIASNTSSIAITSLAQGLKRPERFIGMHFFNPAHVMKLVEIVPGARTTDEVTQYTQKAAQQLGKTSVVAKDFPGFIVNRVARNFYLEAMRIVMEGGANLTQVDALMRSAGFKMGPFELMDVIGLDVNFAVTLSVWEQYFREPRFAPAQMQREYVEAGRLGKKTGEGFYKYSDK